MNASTNQPDATGELPKPPQSTEAELDLPETPPAPPARKRSLWMIGGLALLVVVLAAAAYVGARWLNRAPAGVAAGGPAGGQLKVFRSGSGGNQSFQIEPAKELPARKPDLMGVLVRRQDNSLFLGTGKVMRMVQKTGSETQASPPSYDGPVLEAVVTHDTQIFRDETNLAAPPSGDSSTIQQIIKLGSLDEITPNSVIQVWGQKTGDRTLAQVLVYQPG